MSGAPSPAGEKPQTGSDPAIEQATAAAPSSAGNDTPAAPSTAKGGFNFSDSANPPVFGAGDSTAGQAKPPVKQSVFRNMNAKKAKPGYQYHQPTIPGPTEAQKAELAAKKAGRPTPAAPPAPTAEQVAMQAAKDSFASSLENQDSEAKLRISAQRIADLEATVAKDYETIAASEQKIAKLEKESSDKSKQNEAIKKQLLEKGVELGHKLQEMNPLTQIKNQFEYIKPKYDELQQQHARSQAELKTLQKQHSATAHTIHEYEKDVAEKDGQIYRLHEAIAACEAKITQLHEIIDDYELMKAQSQKVADAADALKEKVDAAQESLEEIFGELGKGLDLPAFIPHIRELKEGANPPPRPILAAVSRLRPGRTAGTPSLASPAPSTTGTATSAAFASFSVVGSAPTAVDAAEAEGSAPKPPVGSVGGASATEEDASALPAAEPASSAAAPSAETVPFSGRRLAAPEPHPFAWAAKRPRAPRPTLPVLPLSVDESVPVLPLVDTTSCGVQTEPAETRCVGVQTSERKKEVRRTVVEMIPVRSRVGSLRAWTLPSWQQLLLLLLVILVGWFAYSTISAHLAWSYANDLSWMDPSPSWAADSRFMLALCQNIEWLIGYEHIVLA